jgi:hypothetical protein
MDFTNSIMKAFLSDDIFGREITLKINEVVQSAIDEFWDTLLQPDFAEAKVVQAFALAIYDLAKKGSDISIEAFIDTLNKFVGMRDGFDMMIEIQIRIEPR